MDFLYFLALPQGYLEPKSQGASCRENNLRAGNVSSLWWALARMPLKIFQKFFFLQNPWVHSSKSCSHHFSLWPSGGSTNWKMRFLWFSKNPTLTQFYAIFWCWLTLAGPWKCGYYVGAKSTYYPHLVNILYRKTPYITQSHISSMGSLLRLCWLNSNNQNCKT